MAIYHLTAKVISRGKGQSAVAAAAYRSGEKLMDEQTGEEKHYRARAERIGFIGIFAPTNAPDWVHSRNDLWNNVERFEKRKDAQLAREIEIALPHELSEKQREWLVKDFVREQFVRRGYAVDVAIHGPDADSDQRNHHAHLMVTMRTIGPDGFAPTKDRSLNTPEQLVEWREEWAHLANRHLERHGHEARIDHRSLEEQGVDREPTIHIGPAARAMTERGRDFASEPIIVPKDFRQHEERLVDYPAIDGGRSRVEHNEAIILRNQERTALHEHERPLTLRERMEEANKRFLEKQREEIEQERAEAAKKPPRDMVGDYRLDWTDRAGMAAQQEDALRAHTLRQGFLDRQQDEQVQPVPPQQREQQEQEQRRRREEDERQQERSQPVNSESATRENTDQQQSRLGSDKAREQSDRRQAWVEWMATRAADRGNRERDDGGRER